MSAKYAVNISPSAQADAVDIWEYIAADSPHSAEKFIDVLQAQLHTLQAFPKRCPLIQENLFLDAEYRHLVFGKYRTIFRVDDGAKAVEVIRIFHSSRLLHRDDLVAHVPISPKESDG